MIDSKALYLRYGKKCDLFVAPMTAALVGSVAIVIAVFAGVRAVAGQTGSPSTAVGLIAVAAALPPVLAWVYACTCAMSVYSRGRSEACRELYDEIVARRTVEYEGASWTVVAHEPGAMKVHLAREGALPMIVSVYEIARYRRMP